MSESYCITMETRKLIDLLRATIDADQTQRKQAEEQLNQVNRPCASHNIHGYFCSKNIFKNVNIYAEKRIFLNIYAKHKENAK